MSHVIKTLEAKETYKSSSPKPKKIRPVREIIYPESDGKPMADNTLQFEWIVKIKEGLEILNPPFQGLKILGCNS